MKSYHPSEKEQCIKARFLMVAPLWLLFFGVILILLLAWPHARAVSGEAKPQIQELNGYVEEGRGAVYTLSNLKKVKRSMLT